MAMSRIMQQGVRPNETDLMTSSIYNAGIWTISKKHHFDSWATYILNREEN